MHSVTRTISHCLRSQVTHRVILLTRFCKLLTRVATPSGGGHVPQVPQWHDATDADRRALVDFCQTFQAHKTYSVYWFELCSQTFVGLRSDPNILAALYNGEEVHLWIETRAQSSHKRCKIYGNRRRVERSLLCPRTLLQLVVLGLYDLRGV